MHKTLNLKKIKIVYQATAAIMIIAVVILTRVLDLDRFQTADEKRWQSNTTAFITNLAHGDWEHLMIQPHPGITAQWLASPTIWSDNWLVKKLSLVASQIILLGAASFLTWRLFGFNTALVAAILLAINPLLIAHTRVLAMDSLLAHFLLISLLSLLLWRKNGQTRYIFFSGLTAAAAILSKLPGLIIIPYATGLLAFNASDWHRKLQAILFWLAALLIGLMLILPSLAINPALVIKDISAWLQSDDYALHAMGPLYYLRSLFFFSTPIHLVVLAVLPFVLFTKTIIQPGRKNILFFIGIATLFLILMSFGAKKGDRYILPAFVTLDLASALLISWIFSIRGKSCSIIIAQSSIALLILLQGWHIWQLHPYYLSYVNPVTQPFFGERRHGWGEGLDLAAAYLNQLPNSSKLVVAAYYPNEFANYFSGETVPLHQHDEAKVDYVVAYRAMYERGAGAWETDVINQYKYKIPKNIIRISGTNMVWIYKK